jgi:hypothetical protein
VEPGAPRLTPARRRVLYAMDGAPPASIAAIAARAEVGAATV